MKYITIGRHPFTDRQRSLLKKVGLEEEVARIVQVDNPVDVVRVAKEKGAKAIVVQALPLPLLAQLLQAARQSGIEVYQFEMETFATVPKSENCPVGTEIEREERNTNFKRCVRTARLVRVKRIAIETEPVAE